jgi:CBS domain-containing protein
MKRRVPTRKGSKQTNGVAANGSKHRSAAKSRSKKERVGVNMLRILAGDGSESGTVVVTCPHCRRSLPLEGATVSKSVESLNFERPKSAPSFSSAGFSLSSAPNAHIRSDVAPQRVRARHLGQGIVAAAHTPISNIMTREVVCVRPDLSAEALAMLFFERGLHGAPVLDENDELIGFVSQADLLRNRYESSETQEVRLRVPTEEGAQYDLGPGFHLEEIAKSTVRELMMPIAISLEESAPITLAAALMATEGVHRVPVVSKRQKVVGILSALDILRWLAKEDGYRTPDYSHINRKNPGATPVS